MTEHADPSVGEPTDRPRVWLVATAFGLGSEVWMHRQASGMPRLDLRVITARYENRDLYPAERFEATVLEHGTKFPPSRAMAQAYLAAWSVWNSGRGWFRGSPKEAHEWETLAAQDPPRLALCQYGVAAVRLAPLFQTLGIPIVAHFHGFDLSSALRGRVYRDGLKRWAPRFAGCVVVAEYQREWLLEAGCDPARVHKIPCGAPIDELPAASRVGDEPCRFLMVGRLTAKKRPDLTLRAFALCRESVPDVRLTIVGDGDLQDDCQRLASELRVSDAIEWLGAQPNSEVKRQIAAAGAFAQHSVTAPNGDKEGWPVSIAEAGMSGLPVIATRHASIPEQVEHGETGLLCDEGDWRAMGENMTTLATDPALRQRMGRAGRAKLAAFDTAGQIRQLEDVLLRAANAPAD